jgi:signal transduction histidine kinase
MASQLVSHGAMKEAPPMLIKETGLNDSTEGKVRLDFGRVGIVVLDQAGGVVSANAQARELLGAESPSVFDGRLKDLRSVLPTPLDGSSEETVVDVPHAGPVSVRSCAVDGIDGAGRVLLLRDGRSSADAAGLLQEAARHQAFAFLASDWAHDLKGVLHVIRINSALLGRLLQRTPGALDAAVTKCLDAIPREVQRLDDAIEVIFGARADARATFDLGRVCERLRKLIAPRAVRQHVEVVLELDGTSKDIAGFEDQVQGALLNVLLNALEAMPNEGRLVISAEGRTKSVTVRVSDTGPGVSAQPDNSSWRARLVNDRRRTAIGLQVADAIVESHDGRIEWSSNVPHGTCVEITFPSASTERLRHGPRTYR